MNYVIICICFVLQINLLYSAEAIYKEFLIDDPDFSLIDKYPEYLTLLKTRIIINDKLRTCIKKSNNIGEDFKKKIDSTSVLELDENLLYFNDTGFISLEERAINTRIKFCVLSGAFVPCDCNTKTSSSSSSPSPTPSSSSSSSSSSSTSSSGSSESSPPGCKTNCKPILLTDDRSIVNVEVMRELAGENNPCQTCDDENMTGCIIDYLSNHQRKGYANDIDKSYCYSDTQKQNNCNDKNKESWKAQINNLIEEDNYSIVSCLFTYHCCAAFNYEYEDAGDGEDFN